MKQSKQSIAISLNLEDRLLKKLTTQPKVPASIRMLLSNEITNEFMEIMTSLDAVESEWMILCGQMTPEQSRQYWAATGSYNICQQRMRNLSVSLANWVRPQILTLVDNEARGNRRNGINAFFKALIRLPSYRLDAIKDLDVFSMQLGWDFLRMSMAIVGADLLDILNTEDINYRMRKTIKDCLTYGENFFQQSMGIEFIGRQFYNERTEYLKTFQGKRNQILLDYTINLYHQYSDEEKEVIRSEIDSLLSIVKREALYKLIPLITLRKDNILNYPQIILMRDDPETGYEYSPLCSVRINFTMEVLRFPEFKQDIAGNACCDYGVRRGIVNFLVNPETGDLCFITSRLPLRLVLPEDRYLALQRYILQGLKKYLLGKEPDIEDLFTFSPQELSEREAIFTRQEESTDDTSLCEHDSYNIKTDSKLDNAIQPRWIHVPFQQRKVTIEQISPNKETVLPKHFRSAVMAKISGANAKTLIAAFRRMFGEETRVSGGHIFFRSERTNQVLPIPRHSRGNKNSISLGLILNNLHMWGYSTMELAKELGLRVPTEK